jgi:hypothetical protein
MNTLTSEQKFELLRQIFVDYGLYNYINEDRACWPFKSYEVGADLAILDDIVNGEGLYPVAYQAAVERIKYRLGIR